MNVLFVSTDDDLRATARDVLEVHGINLLSTERIQEAKTVLDKEHPAFVVIGEHLENGSPFDLFNYILEYHPSTPTVILASDLDEKELERRPEKVMPYEPGREELALESLADTIKASASFQAETLYPEPEDEEERVEVLHELNVDALEEASFHDRLTRMGARMFDVDMCYVGLIDADEERFLACHGTDLDDIEREETICSYAIITDDVMVVDDVQHDPRFTDMDAVQELDISWYASAPITIDGHRIGTFCIADTEPHQLTSEDKQQLQWLANEFAERLADYRA